MPVTKQNNTFYMSNTVDILRNKADGEHINHSEHYHDFVELVYTLSGKCVHVINGVEYPIRRGDMVIVNYNHSHSIKGSSEAEYINILMKPQYISQALINHENAFSLLNLNEFESFKEILNQEKRCITFTSEERKQAEQIILLEKEMKEKMPGCELTVRSGLNILKSATTTSSGGLILALKRAILHTRLKGGYRKHCYWQPLKRGSLTIFFS